MRCLSVSRSSRSSIVIRQIDQKPQVCQRLPVGKVLGFAEPDDFEAVRTHGADLQCCAFSFDHRWSVAKCLGDLDARHQMGTLKCCWNILEPQCEHI